MLHHLKHKLRLWNWGHLKSIWKDYGLPLVVIFVVWEIIEDIIFPAVFYLLGLHVNEVFYLGIPVAWVLCLHPVAVPVIWAIYCFMLRKKHK